MKNLYYWHIHHETLVEAATEPIENRIAYIKTNKPANEVELRLRLLHVVQAQDVVTDYKAKCAQLWVDHDAKLAPLLAGIEALHRIECPNCPWDGTTIFPVTKRGDGDDETQ